MYFLFRFWNGNDLGLYVIKLTSHHSLSKYPLWLVVSWYLRFLEHISHVGIGVTWHWQVPYLFLAFVSIWSYYSLSSRYNLTGALSKFFLRICSCGRWSLSIINWFQYSYWNSISLFITSLYYLTRIKELILDHVKKASQLLSVFWWRYHG